MTRPRVHPAFPAARVASRMPQSPLLWAGASRPSSSPAPPATLAGGTCTSPSSSYPGTGEPVARRLGSTPPRGAPLSTLRQRDAGGDPLPPPTPTGAAMRTPAFSPISPGIVLTATYPAGGGAPPPGRLSLTTRCRASSSARPSPPWCRPIHWASMHQNRPDDRRPASKHLANCLLKRLTLDYNSIQRGTAVPFNTVVVSAPRHKNSYSLCCVTRELILRTIASYLCSAPGPRSWTPP
jgi:hypothetical protein